MDRLQELRLRRKCQEGLLSMNHQHSTINEQNELIQVAAVALAWAESVKEGK